MALMNLDYAIKIFSEFMHDCGHNVKCPRHGNTEDLFMAMRRLAIEYMNTDKAAIALQRIKNLDNQKGFYNPATQEDYDTMHDYMKPKNKEAKHND
jgi:hypothetical protein